MQPVEADLTILEHIENEPDTSQATLAERLGVAVGTVNWHMKRLIQKGYIKVKRAQRRKLKYLITPEGIALRARLMVDYLQSSLKLYRLVRERSVRVITSLKQNGVNMVRIEGNNDVSEICRLTCMEQGLQITRDFRATLIHIDGLKIFLDEDKK